MNKISDKLASSPVLLSDGAWGTFLQKNGLQPGDCPDEWSLSHRDIVFSIAKSYVDAGCDMIESNSFGANKFKLAHFSLADQVIDINKAAAGISREAAGKDVAVIASIGPTGKILLMGDVSEQELEDAFAIQAHALKDGGADALCIETFTALDEAHLAIKAAKSTGLEVICTFTFEKTVTGEFRTMMGVSPSQLAEMALSAGVDVIGTNCGNGMELMVPIVGELRAAAPDAPILVHANAGMPTTVNGETVFPETPEQMAANAVKARDAGANILGGCCGTTPQHIAEIGKAIRG